MIRLGGWRGAIGVQLGDREFSVVGEEAFTPPVDTSSVGLFWVGERSLGETRPRGGPALRPGRARPRDTASSRDFSGGSASLGLIVPLGRGLGGHGVGRLLVPCSGGRGTLLRQPAPRHGRFRDRGSLNSAMSRPATWRPLSSGGGGALVRARNLLLHATSRTSFTRLRYG